MLTIRVQLVSLGFQSFDVLYLFVDLSLSLLDLSKIVFFETDTVTHFKNNSKSNQYYTLNIYKFMQKVTSFVGLCEELLQ